MIPRFIVRNASQIMQALLTLGYTYSGSVPLTDILVIGNVIQQAPEIESERDRLIRCYDGRKEPGEIIKQAKFQLEWQMGAERQTITVGSKNTPIDVTRQGVMIDSFVMPIDSMRELKQSVLNLTNPMLAAHTPVVNPTARFMTVGCSDYSLDDLDLILSTHESLNTAKVA